MAETDPKPHDPTTDPDTDQQDRPADLLVPPSRQARRQALGGGGGGGAGDTGPASHVPASLRHVDWGESFPFVHLFKGFRIAVHPPKLLLALAAVLLIYAGGRTLDGIWGLLPPSWHGIAGEADTYDRYHTGLATTAGAPGVGENRPSEHTNFAQVRTALRERREAQFDQFRQAATLTLDERVEEIDSGDVVRHLQQVRDDRLTVAKEQLEAARERQLEGEASDARTIRLTAAEADYEREVRAAYAAASRDAAALDEIDGRGLFEEFYQYETDQMTAATAAVLSFDFTGPTGLFASLYRFVWVGPRWAFSQHAVYFTLLFAWSLVILSVCGGALARIAAVQVARDEALSLRSSLRFSAGKFVSFLSAPLIPVLVIGLIVLAIAAVVLVLWLIGLIPYMGWVTEIGIALLLPLALIGGFLMALSFVGLIGGISLMYPTIAAEGTDSFDAISRSFSYLFARPWRLAFYALVALAYGAVTFLFVRLLVWLVLALTHGAASLLLFRTAAGVNLLEAMWPSPANPATLSYDVPFINLTLGQKIAAVIISIWVYGLISLLVAYVVSLYLSLSTVIYFLMRREVDATELDEVYLDPADEDYDAYADVPEDPNADPLETPTDGVSTTV